MTDRIWIHRRLFRKAVQQGRSERRGESYSVPYVEPLSDVRTPLVAVVYSPLEEPYAFDGFGNNVHTNIIASIVRRKEEEAGPS